ncbi:hypothetical protein JCM3775_001319 [Rhodotorula graminis]
MTTTRWTTLKFKEVQGVDFNMDVYLPSEDQLRKSGRKRAPVLVYYHGGGLCVGDRGWNDWVGKWMFYGAVEAGIAVISCDYTLLGPHSGEHIIDDVKDALIFIRDELNHKLDKHESTVRVDPKNVAVSGASGGGLVAYYAGIHSPYPLKAVLAMYGGGGDLLSDWYLQEKKAPFFPGMSLLPSSAPFDAILDRDPRSTPPTISVPPGSTDPALSSRHLLFVWLLQSATLVDALSGVRGASAALRALPEKGDARAHAAAENPHGKRTLPQLGISASFPPTFFAHGTADEIVHLAESRHLSRVLERVGVECVLWEVEGGGHGFDTEGGWASSPGASDPELTRKKDEGLKRIVPWLVDHFD